MKRVLALARSHRLWWWSLALFAGTIACLYWPGTTDLRLRAWGLLLQIVGILTVAHDISSTRVDRGLPGFLAAMRQSLAELLRGKNVSIAFRGNALVFTGGTARITQRRVPGPSVEDRVNALEENFRQLDNELNDHHNLLTKEQRAREDAIKAERLARESFQDKFQEQLTGALTANSSLLGFGALWLLVGVVFGTVAPEVKLLVSGNWQSVWRNL